MIRFRARDLGINIGTMTAGPLNSITDIEGIKVGHETIIKGEGDLVPGEGPVRTGVTTIFPHGGDTYLERVPAAIEWFNGFGECFGYGFVQQYGFIIGPIVLTNSFNVYRVADALQDWSIEQHPEVGFETHGLLCVVAECSDDYLNDIQGRHVHREHVLNAIRNARSGTSEEGSIGAGTGTMTFEWKGGIGTSSRIVPLEHEHFTVGVLTLTNFGIHPQLIINGVPVGSELAARYKPSIQRENEGSCVIVIATDAPLSSQQLQRLNKRAFLGMARTGGTGRNGSGDLAITFSTSNRITRDPKLTVVERTVVHELSDSVINGLFQAAVDATEEATLNSMFMSDTMTGRDGHVVPGLPIPEVIQIMNKYGYSLKL
ncbi:MAG: P1 family peptidase, partial [Anaerolineae bacterium]|nr:P1 family peptidase [Anaerolineae bacterium]